MWVHSALEVCKITQEVLYLEGYSASIAPSGRSALATLREAPQGMIVFLDPMMLASYENAGLKAFLMDAKLRARHVVLLWEAAAYIEKAKRYLQVDGDLPQPFTNEQLLTTVEHAEEMWRSKQQTEA
jgi:DNA-binding NtrC family response regulator